MSVKRRFDSGDSLFYGCEPLFHASVYEEEGRAGEEEGDKMKECECEK